MNIVFKISTDTNMESGSHKKLHMGKLVKEITEKKQISPTRFGEMLNTSRTNVYSIFTRQEIKLDLLRLISDKLDYDFFQHLSHENTEIFDNKSANIIIKIEIRNEMMHEFIAKTIHYFSELQALSGNKEITQ